MQPYVPVSPLGRNAHATGTFIYSTIRRVSSCAARLLRRSRFRRRRPQTEFEHTEPMCRLGVPLSVKSLVATIALFWAGAASSRTASAGPDRGAARGAYKRRSEGFVTSADMAGAPCGENATSSAPLLLLADGQPTLRRPPPRTARAPASARPRTVSPYPDESVGPSSKTFVFPNGITAG
jgi:hypothetical protein